MSTSAYVGRFAPTPSGDLHLGTLTTALASWLRARQQGGSWLVRIDDLDPHREVYGSTDSLLAGLARCGLQADAPPLYQSTRMAVYQNALARLQEQGLVFECWCSRRDLRNANTLHRDGACLHGPVAGRPPALRLHVPAGEVIFDDLYQGRVREDVRESVGDFVLRRADGCFAYHLACVVDEAHLGVSEVIRGRDLLASTARQLLLARLLGLPQPGYGHIPLVRGADGHKIAKSEHNATLDLSDPVRALAQALAFLGCPAPPPRLVHVADLLHWACQHCDPATFGT